MDHDLFDDDDDGSGAFRPSRRKVLAVAAWTVPVVVVAQAAPAFAASPGVVQFTGTSCKHPGASQPPFKQDYHFQLLIKNTTGSDVNVTITAVYVGASAGDATARNFSVGANVVPVDTTPKVITVPASAGSAGITYIVHANGDASANSYIRVEYTYAGVPGTLSSSTLSSDPCVEPAASS